MRTRGRREWQGVGERKKWWRREFDHRIESLVEHILIAI